MWNHFLCKIKFFKTQEISDKNETISLKIEGKMTLNDPFFIFLYIFSNTLKRASYERIMTLIFFKLLNYVINCFHSYTFSRFLALKFIYIIGRYYSLFCYLHNIKTVDLALVSVIFYKDINAFRIPFHWIPSRWRILRD